MATTIEKFDEAMGGKTSLQTVPGEERRTNDDEGYRREPPNWQYYREPPPLMLEDHSGLDLQRMFKALWYYRGMFATIALVLATLFVAANHYIMPDKYEATARVRVKMLGIDDDIATARTFSIIPTEVLSDKVLTKVINDLDMTKKDTDPIIVRGLKAIGVDAKETVEDGSGIMRWLRQDIAIGQERQGSATAVFTVSLVDKDPAAAAEIVNAIVNAYIDLRHTFESSDASEAVAFLQPKVDAAEKAVNAAHERLTAFQMDNTSYLVPAQTIEENIARLQLEYTDSAHRIEQLGELNTGLKNLLKGEPRYVAAGTVVPGAPNAVASELGILEQRLVVAQSRYVEGHPFLKQLRSDIAALKKANRNAPAAARSSGQVSNPEWLRLSQEIAANEAEYTVLKRRMPSIEQNIVELTQHLSQAKSAQAALLTHQSAWDQAYNQLRILSEQLLEAETKADAQTSTVGKDLSILDEAAIPTLPITASRTKLQMIGVIGGFAISFALILIYARVKNWEVPENGKQVGVFSAIMLNLLSFSWFVALIGYIIVSPYI